MPRTVVGTARAHIGRRLRHGRRELLDEEGIALGGLREDVRALFELTAAAAVSRAALRARALRLGAADRAAAPCRRGDRRPRRVSRRAARAATARARAPAPRGADRPASRRDRAGSSRPSADLRTRERSADRAPPPRRSRARRRRASRGPRPFLHIEAEQDREVVGDLLRFPAEERRHGLAQLGHADL